MNPSKFAYALALSQAEVRKAGIMLRRYPFGPLVSVIILTLVFLALVRTATGFGGGVRGVEFAVTIQTYLLWTALIASFGAIQAMIEQDSRSGLLEQVLMSPASPAFYFSLRALISGLVSLAITLVIAAVLSALFGAPNVLSMRLLLALAIVLPSAIGIGLILGGMTLVWKDIGPLDTLLQFALLPLFLGLDPVPWLVSLALPGLPALALLHAGDNGMIAALIAAIAWLSLGVICFMFCLNIARKRGLIYQY